MVYGAVYRSDNVSAAMSRIVQLAAEMCDFSRRPNIPGKGTRSLRPVTKTRRRRGAP
jgi:hypothetical protein